MFSRVIEYLFCSCAVCRRKRAHKLCADCDKVAHKVATRRDHILIPIRQNSQSFQVLNSENVFREILDAALAPLISVDLNMSLVIEMNESVQNLFAFLSQPFRVSLLLCLQLFQIHKAHLEVRQVGLPQPTVSTIVPPFPQLNESTSLFYPYIKVLAVVRGLMDDRAARHQFIPMVLLESLSILMRQFTVSAPCETDQLKFGEKDLQMTADYRDDVVSPSGYDIASKGFSGFDTNFPSDEVSCWDQRVVISLLLQCIGRTISNGTSHSLKSHSSYSDSSTCSPIQSNEGKVF